MAIYFILILDHCPTMCCSMYVCMYVVFIVFPSFVSHHTYGTAQYSTATPSRFFCVGLGRLRTPRNQTRTTAVVLLPCSINSTRHETLLRMNTTAVYNMLRTTAKRLFQPR